MPIRWFYSLVLNVSGSSRNVILYLPVGCLPLRMCDLLHASRGSFTQRRLTESALLNKPLSSSSIFFHNVTLFFSYIFMLGFFFHSLESKKPEDFDRLFSLRIVFCFTLPTKWKLGFSPAVWFTLIYNLGCWQNIRKKTEKYTRWLSVSPEETKSTLKKRSEKSRADLNFLPVLYLLEYLGV